MDSSKLTRKRFIVAGVASAAGAAGAAVGTASAAETDLIIGHFVRAQGARVGIVAIEDGKTVSVHLDSGAFVVHGADEIVDTLTAFLPGEHVVARGEIARGRVAATEFQSVYRSVTGAFATDPSGHWLVTSTGQRVRVPENVLRRDAPRGLRSGESRKATIWIHPTTGEAVVVGFGVADS